MTSPDPTATTSGRTGLFVGLISGTSMDGIDAALLDCSGESPVLLSAHGTRYPDELRARLVEATRIENPQAADLGALDADLGRAFAAATLTLLKQADIKPQAVAAIGSHGQTIRHEPDVAEPYSLQIGNPQVISALTGIDVVADFRTADILAGGQGAPLVPAFHHAVFSTPLEPRVILNIGGIANITILPDQNASHVTGFDTGPGNTLMDNWMRLSTGAAMDRDGAFAASGTISTSLLNAMLADSYFSRPPPKSTGPEYFSMQWLEAHGPLRGLRPADVQSTLCELTAATITDAIRNYAPATRRVLVCGGGVHNHYLMQRMADRLAGITVGSTESCGIHPDWVEAAAFAWLARQRLAGAPGNLPAVTGARKPVLLGDVFPHAGL